MIYLLMVCILVVAVYGVYLTVMVHKRLAESAVLFETELKEIRSLAEVTVKKPSPKTPPTLAQDCLRVVSPWAETDEEANAPIENPAPEKHPDEYLVQMWIAEYQSFPSPYERRDFVRRLMLSGAAVNTPEFLDVVFADESPCVRTWAAAHLQTVFGERNYETALLSDPYPIVGAALWSNPMWRNPESQRLPWAKFPAVNWRISENWKERFRGMTNLERLGLMRNPELSTHFVVALMETPSEELNISRVEHAEVLVTAAMNPKLINSSRLSGRQSWVVNDWPNEPIEEYAQMWELGVNKWMDQSRVPYFFLKFIQTTPKMKVAIYQTLLANGKEAAEPCPGMQVPFEFHPVKLSSSMKDGVQRMMVLREALIESCDPMLDGPVIKLAWIDPSEVCRKAVRERIKKYDIGRYTSFLGIAQDASNNA
jgi:hypothetical protein